MRSRGSVTDVSYIITEDLAQRLDDWHAIWDQKLVDRDQSHLDTHYYRAMLRFYMNFYKRKSTCARR